MLAGLKGMDISHFFKLSTALLVLAVGLGFGLFCLIASHFVAKLATKARVQGSGLFGVVGLFGRGKSYFLVAQAVHAMSDGRKVFSNFYIEGSYKLDDWTQILAVPDDAMVVIDEAHIWWPSISSAPPVEVKAWITQLRHRDILVFWASQDISFVGRWLRVLSEGVFESARFKSGHRYTLYDARVAESRSLERRNLGRLYLKRKPKVMAAYNTKDRVGHSVEWGGQEPVRRLQPSTGPGLRTERKLTVVPEASALEG